jgi:DNA-directed RNA polymerase subunit K/omega
MPFDGVGFAVGDRVSKIDQIIDLLATPDRWCKGQFKNPDGSYCIRGAMMAVQADEALKPVVLQAIHDVTGQRYWRIESFNDHPYTRYAQVRRVLARARQLVVDGWTPEMAAHAGWSAIVQALRHSISRSVGARLHTA